MQFVFPSTVSLLNLFLFLMLLFIHTHRSSHLHIYIICLGLGTGNWTWVYQKGWHNDTYIVWKIGVFTMYRYISSIIYRCLCVTLFGEPQPTWFNAYYCCGVYITSGRTPFISFNFYYLFFFVSVCFVLLYVYVLVSLQCLLISRTKCCNLVYIIFLTTSVYLAKKWYM